MPQKIIVKLYDIDGCLYHAFRTDKSLADRSPATWLLKTNQDFLAEEIKLLNTEVYHKVIIAYGTNRQDYETDAHNASCNPSGRTHTCAPVLPILQSYFSHHVTSEVVLEPFLMADLYHDVIGGTSYFAMLKQIYAYKNKTAHNKWVFDDNKLTLIYTYVHRTACLHPGKDISIVVDFFDDRDDILEYLHLFFENAPDLLPRNVIFRLNRYKGAEVGVYPLIHGMGPIDFNYQWSIRLLAISGLTMNTLNVDIIMRHEKYRTSNSVAVLQEFHRNKRYFNTGYAQLDFQRMFKAVDLNEFRKLRNNEIFQLKPDKIFHKAAYTTALKLFKKKLIPSNLVFMPSQKDEMYLGANGFAITAITHKKIIAELDTYILARGVVNINDIYLSWTSRHFRNANLTREKLKLANDLKQKISSTTNHSELMAQLEAYQILHNKLEQQYNKIYGCLTKSGLAKNLHNISKILLIETIMPPACLGRHI